MKHEKNDEEKRIDSIEEYKDSNARRIDQLIDVVEKHTRTERHLEQNLSMSNIKDVKHTLKVQEKREDEIENLKNIIAYGKHEKNNELKNLSRNYSFAENYLDHYEAKMDSNTLDKTKAKQANRKVQMESLKDNSFH